MIGQRFGRLTVIAESPKRGHNKQWRSRCDCGGETVSFEFSLKSGRAKSCGCLKIEGLVQRSRRGPVKTAHKMSFSSEYRIWINMRQRCSNPANSRWSSYGGRGITVCGRWDQSFEAFIQDMGLRPTIEHSLDRIENNGPYSPDNCRWATATEQQNNTGRWTKSVLIEGKDYTLREIAARAGLTVNGAAERVRRGVAGVDLLKPRQKARG